MTDKEIYENAYSAFVPAPEDAVENLPFYRSWAAFQTLLRSYGFNDPYAAPINAHSICCWEKSGKHEEFLKVLPMHKPKQPEKPVSYRCCYHSEPPLPTEEAAKSIFAVQFKDKFPGKRLNSKFAKEKYELCKEKAMEFAMQDYAREKAEYDAKVEKTESRWKAEDDAHAKSVEQWNAAVSLIEKLSNGGPRE